MSAVERLAIIISADGQGAIREFDKVGKAAERDLGGAENRADRLGSRMTSAGAVMMGASAVMAAGMWNVGQAAAAQEQAVGGSEAVFKSSAGEMRSWAKGADEAAGLSEEAGLRLTTRLGGALKGLGYDQKAAADQSKNLVQVAADLAATYGGTTADAVQALGAAYRGEFDPAEQFNLFLKQSTVDAKAVEMGLATSTSQVDAYARAQAVTALIMEQSTDAQGQFARELDTATGQLAVSQAQFENMKAELGAGFLPVMARVGGIAGEAASGVASLDEASGGMVSNVAAWGTVLLGASGGVSFLGGQVIKARDNFVKGKDGVKSFFDSIQASPTQMIGATAALVALSAATYAYQQRLDEAAASGRRNAEDVAGGGTAADKLGALRTRLEQVNKELEKQPKDNGVGTSAFLRFATGADKATASLEAERDALNEQIDALNKSTDATSEAASVVQEHVDKLKAERQALEDKQNALLGLGGGFLDLQSKQIASREALEDYDKKMADSTLSANEREQAGVDLLQTYMAEAEATAATAAKMAEANGVQLTAADRAAIQKQKLQELADTLAPGSPLRAQLQGFIDSLNAIPPSKTTRLDVDTLVATGKLDAILTKMAMINGTPVRVVDPHLLPRDKDGNRASGGPVRAGGVYGVFDTSTPEILDTPSGSYLIMGAESGHITNLASTGSSSSRGAMGGSGGAQVLLDLRGASFPGVSNANDFVGQLTQVCRANQGEIRRALGLS